MLAYLDSIWRCRQFWLSLVINDLQLRYRRSILGIGWSLLHPLAMACITAVVFCEIFKIPIREMLPFMLSGLACWSYITGSIFQGCQSYVQAESYIRQHPLPLAVYPLRTTLGVLIHFVIALMLVFFLTCIFRQTINVTALAMLIPGLGVLFLFGWAVAILAGYIHTVFRDTQHILELVFQVIFYLTPLVYPMRVLSNTRIGWLLAYNPLIGLLNLVRHPLIESRPPSMTSVLVASGMTLVLGMIAMASLRYQQRRIILYL